MSQSIGVRLSKLENDYYDGVGTDRLIARIEEIARALSELKPEDPVRLAFEENALILWGQLPNSPISHAVVQEAMASADAAVYVRAWANFWKTLAATQNVA
jgi:hypothetical protein